MEKLPHLQAIMQELQKTYDEFLCKITKAKSDEEFLALAQEYNEVAKRAAWSFYKDTEDRNSWKTIKQVYATPDRDGVFPKPNVFMELLINLKDI